MPEIQNAIQIGDRRSPVVQPNEMNGLVGKLLTLTDATFTDTVQRKAQKDVLRELLWDWRRSTADYQMSDVEQGWRPDGYEVLPLGPRNPATETLRPAA